MSLLRSALAVASRSTTVTGMSLYDLLTSLDNGTSAAGASVTRESALCVAAWWRAITLRAGAGGKASRDVKLKKRASGGYVDATDHPAWRALREFRDMTRFHFYSTRLGHKASLGNGLALVIRGGPIQPVEMVPIDPTRITPFRENGTLKYLYTSDQLGSVKLPAADVVHFKGYGFDGLSGYSVVQKARDTLGLSMAMSTHGAKFFANGAQLGVILQHPGQMSKEAQDRFLASWKTAREGASNAFKTLIAEEGMTVADQKAMSAEDAQLIETHLFTNRQIGLFTGIPPHKLGDPSTKTYASQEMDEQGLLSDTTEPDLIEMEQELEAKLLTVAERANGEYVIEFSRKGLVTPNAKDAAEADGKALAGYPWRTVNEVRRDRGENPVPGGDEIQVPINLKVAGGVASPKGGGDPPPASPPTDPPDDPSIDPAAARASAVLVAADARRRMAKRIGAQVRKAAKDSKSFPAFIETLHRDHEAVVREAFGPAASVAALADGRSADFHLTALAGALLLDVRTAADAAYTTAKPADFPAKIDAAMAALES